MVPVNSLFGIALDLVGVAFILQNMQKVLLYSCCSDNSYNVFDVLSEANRRKMKIEVIRMQICLYCVFTHEVIFQITVLAHTDSNN